RDWSSDVCSSDLHHLRAPPRMAPIHTLSSPHHLGQPHIGPNRQHLKMLLLLPQVQPPTRTSRRNNPPRPRPPPASTPASTPRRPIRLRVGFRLRWLSRL